MKKENKKNDLFKIILVAILVTFVLTWLIPYGYYSAGELTSSGLGRLGLSDLLASSVYSVSFFLQQIIFVAVVGIFYGILSKTNGYSELVKKVAKLFKKKEYVFVIVSTLFITLITSFFTQTFIVLLFVPFIISIAKELHLDKITSFMCTFGAMFIGILGALFGTEGLVYFVSYLNYYADASVKTAIIGRVIALVVIYLVYVVFTLLHVKKVLNSKKSEEDMVEDLFIESDTQDKKKSHVWPMALIFGVLLVISILGYVDWETNFNISVFETFHTWLTELAIGDYTVIGYILGNNATSFGTWQIYSILPILAIVLVIAILMYRVKLDDVIDGAIKGAEKMIKPILLMIGAYMIFVFIYWCPFTATVTDWIVKLASGFNPFLTTISAAIASLFHADFGYTGYVVGDLMANFFGDNFSAGFLVYTTINGLVQLVAPTSVLLLIGLSTLDITYKNWIKNIWKFAVIALLILLIIFVFAAYVF